MTSAGLQVQASAPTTCRTGCGMHAVRYPTLEEEVELQVGVGLEVERKVAAVVGAPAVGVAAGQRQRWGGSALQPAGMGLEGLPLPKLTWPRCAACRCGPGSPHAGCGARAPCRRRWSGGSRGARSSEEHRAHVTPGCLGWRDWLFAHAVCFPGRGKVLHTQTLWGRRDKSGTGSGPLTEASL